MANVYKSPAQLKPLADTLEDLYTVPSGTQTIVSNIHVCNLDSLQTDIRIAIRPAGAEISDEHYVFHDLTIAAKDTVQLGDGLTMGAADVISVYSVNGEVVFNMSYAEVS
jgi:ATP-dependent protease ClpP protease subunit